MGTGVKKIAKRPRPYDRNAYFGWEKGQDKAPEMLLMGWWKSQEKSALLILQKLPVTRQILYVDSVLGIGVCKV